MKLVIISHTEHYLLPDGTVVGWGPTVNEINHLTNLFETIYHIGMLHQGTPPKSAIPYASKAIHFIPMPALGGKTFKAKLQTLWMAPRIISLVRHTLKQADIFQFRAPTGIGVYVIPYLTWFSHKKGWFKYAGNWNQQQAPMGYAWQRWFLKQQRRTVTINGVWPKQPKHCISFPNPCLGQDDFEEGFKLSLTKHVDEGLQLCYAGRMEHEKGVGSLLQALKVMDAQDKNRIKALHLIGEGAQLETFKRMSQDLSIPVIWHGSLTQQALFEIYKICHLFVMPTTASEGFPKVLAEAMNFGCIPVVTDVSAISHFIKHQEHGWLLPNADEQTLLAVLRVALHLNTTTFQQMLQSQRGIVKQFTFANYTNQIKVHILKNKKKY